MTQYLEKAMEKISGAEAMVRMLQLNGVKHIFGLCGDTSLPFYDALKRLDHGMQHVLTRDERLGRDQFNLHALLGPKGGERGRGFKRRNDLARRQGGYAFNLCRIENVISLHYHESIIDFRIFIIMGFLMNFNHANDVGCLFAFAYIGTQ